MAGSDSFVKAPLCRGSTSLRYSSKQFLDHLLPLIDDSHGSAVAGVEVLGVVDVQRLADGGHEVDGADGPLLHVGPLPVGAADDLAGLEAAAGQQGRPGPRVVIAAALLADVRRP